MAQKTQIDMMAINIFMKITTTNMFRKHLRKVNVWLDYQRVGSLFFSDINSFGEEIGKAATLTLIFVLVINAALTCYGQ